jgi:dTDP-4-dehydrorhamnose reductase
MMASWVIDQDVSDQKRRSQWMVYDEEESETTPVIARQVRSESLATFLAAAAKMHAALVEVKRTWHAQDGSEQKAYKMLKEALDAAGEHSIEDIQAARGPAK